MNEIYEFLDIFYNIELIDFTAMAHYLGALTQRFHIVYILSAVLMTAWSWWYYEKRGRNVAQGFIAFCFPPDYWTSPSAMLDYRYVFFDRMAVAALGGAAAVIIDRSVDSNPLGGFWYVPQDPSIAIVLAYTACVLVSEDFFRYWSHRIMHMSPILWEFHKVHHSSKTLTPITKMREHPINAVINLLRSLIGVGIVTAAFYVVWPDQITPVTVLGVNVGRFLFNFMGGNLRHSHIWVSWGPVFSRIFISPAMHQIHHSNNPKHFDRNFGSQFALWDWLFGTLYVPKTREHLSYGLTPDEDVGQYNSIWALYSVPFIQAQRLVRDHGAETYLRFRLLNPSQPAVDRLKAGQIA